VNTQTVERERTFNAYKLVNNVPVFQGYVKGVNRTAADRRATNLYGAGTWTTERD